MVHISYYQKKKKPVKFIIHKNRINLFDSIKQIIYYNTRNVMLFKTTIEECE